MVLPRVVCTTECDSEASTVNKSWPTRGCHPKKKVHLVTYLNHRGLSQIENFIVRSRCCLLFIYSAFQRSIKVYIELVINITIGTVQNDSWQQNTNNNNNNFINTIYKHDIRFIQRNVFSQSWVMRLELFTGANIKVMVFWNVTCNLIYNFQRFACICRLHLQGRRMIVWEVGWTLKPEVTDFSSKYYTARRHIPNQHSNMWLYFLLIIININQP